MEFSKITFKQQVLLKIIGFVIAAVIFLYTTFATVDYVDAKHLEGIHILTDIRDRVIRIENYIINQ